MHAINIKKTYSTPHRFDVYVSSESLVELRVLANSTSELQKITKRLFTSGAAMFSTKHISRSRSASSSPLSVFEGQMDND